MSLFSQPSSPPRRERQRVLRDYQVRAISDVAASLHENPILVIPTAGGKTFTASRLIAELTPRVLWIAERTELVEQAAIDLRSLGLTVGIIKSGVPSNPFATVQVASKQTLINRDMPEVDLIVIDECHHAVAQGYARIFDNYPNTPRLGLTATPFRLDGRGLGDVFGKLIVAATTADLVAAGYIHAPKVYAGEPPDLRGVKVNGGEYNLGQLAARMTAQTTADVVEVWQQRCPGVLTLAFGVDIEHSLRITRSFRDAGIAAEHVDGDTHKDDRRNILERFRRGETLVVSNCGVFLEGTDLPMAKCLIDCSPTASLGRHLQKVGRIMRLCPSGLEPIVLDHAGNHHVHGLVTRRLTYSLDGSVRVGSSDPLGLRQCSQCFILYPSDHACCSECGYTPTPAERVTPGVHGTGEMGEFVEDFNYRRRIWNLIEAEREGNEYAKGWAAYRYKERFGEWPVLVGRELLDIAHATMEEKKAVYTMLLAGVRERGSKDGAAAHQYRDIFGVWPRGFTSEVRDRSAIAARWAGMTGNKQ